MTAVDTFVADLRANKYSSRDQVLLATVDNFIAALNQLNTGSYSQVTALITSLQANKASMFDTHLNTTVDLAIAAFNAMNVTSLASVNAFVADLFANRAGPWVQSLIAQVDLFVAALNDLAVSTVMVVRNIASRGQAPVATSTPPATKTRGQARWKYWIFYPCTQVAIVWANKYLLATSAGEGSSGTSAYTINKCAFEQNGTFTPILFSGIASATVAAGAFLTSDFVNFNVQASAVAGFGYLRAEIDYGTNYCYGRWYNGAEDNINGGIEQSIFFPPANEIDQIYGTGALATPTGGQNQVQHAPFVLVGKIIDSNGFATDAIVGLGDSILDGSIDVDMSASGQFGGGYARRGCYAAGKPYISCAVVGNGITYTLASHTLFDLACTVSTIGLNENGQNDIGVLTRTKAQMEADLISVQGIARANGLRKIGQTNITSRTNTTDSCTTLVNQTVFNSGFASGGTRDQLQTDLLASGHLGFDFILDVWGNWADPTTQELWAVPAYTSFLTAAALSTDTTLSLNDNPPLNSTLICSPGGRGGGTTSGSNFCIKTVSGSGPFIGTSYGSIAIGQAQLINAPVAASQSISGLHPFTLPDINVGTIFATLLATL